jgi:hypothetical protein
MSFFRLGAGVLALWVLEGCGGSKPADQVVSPAATGTGQVVVLSPMSPVSAPAELFAVARIANLEKTADTAVAWSGLPLNWRSLIEKDVPGISRIVALSAPVDFAAALDPGPGEMPKVRWAFAVGAASTDAAVGFFRQQGIGVVSREGGAYQASVKDDLACVIDRALGAAPTRVVCSSDLADVEVLLPYLTRGMPTESFGKSDIHAHVAAEPFRRRYGAQVGMVRTVGVPFLLRELSVDHPKLDRALHEVLYGGADEIVALAGDADRLDFDIAVSPGDVLDVSTSLSFSGQKSWSSQTLAKASSQMAGAPETFWKLPATATSGNYNTYADTERLRGIVLSLRDLMDGFLDYHKMTEARRRPLIDAFEKVATSGARSASATLPFSATAAGPSSEDVQALKAAIGQHLGVTEKGGAEAMAFFSEFTKSVGDKGLRDNLLKKHKIPANMLPTAKERPLTGKDLPAGGKRYELTLPGALLSGGKLALDQAGQKAKGKAGPPLTVHLIALPDGPLTWIAIGTDDKALIAALTEARAGTGKTLATRDGLAPLRTLPTLSGGFTTLSAVLASIDEKLSRFGKERFAIDKLPHLGMTPILLTFTSTMKGQGATATLAARIPRAVVEDSVGLAATEVARKMH